MRAAVYARVSTEEQSAEGTSLDTQQEACLKRANEQGYEVTEEHTFIETYSGLTRDRPKLNRLRELIRGRVINALVCYSSDRLARDPVDLILLVDECEESKVDLLFVTEDLDNSDMGKLITHIKGFAHKLEAEKIRERTMRGKRARARDRQMLPTGGLNKYGYIYDKTTGKRTRNEYEVAVIRKMVEWLLKEHVSLNEICRRLMVASIPTPRGSKRWSRATVGGILKNKIYTGETWAYTMEAVEPNTRRGGHGKTGRKLLPRDQWIKLPDDTTPQIITPEEFEAIQRQLERNRELSPRNQRHEYLLRGHIYCQECGRRYFGTILHHRRHYRCGGRHPTQAWGDICRNRGVNADELEGKVWSTFVDTIMEPERLIQAYRNRDTEGYIDGLRQQLQNCQGRLRMLDNAETRLIRLFEFTLMSEDKAKVEMGHNQAQRKEVEKELAQVEKAITHYKEAEITEEQIATIADHLRGLLKDGKVSLEAKRQLFEDLRMKVWISRDFHAIQLALVPISGMNTVSTQSQWCLPPRGDRSRDWLRPHRRKPLSPVLKPGRVGKGGSPAYPYRHPSGEASARQRQ